MDVRGLPSHGFEEAQLAARRAEDIQFDPRTMRREATNGNWLVTAARAIADAAEKDWKVWKKHRQA